MQTYTERENRKVNYGGCGEVGHPEPMNRQSVFLLQPQRLFVNFSKQKTTYRGIFAHFFDYPLGKRVRRQNIAPNAVYPTKYDYDALGRREYMTTYQDSGIVFTGTTWPSAADATGKGQTTHWEYDPGGSGLLVSKTDAADPGNKVSYTYYPGGRLHTRTWADGRVTTC